MYDRETFIKKLFELNYKTILENRGDTLFFSLCLMNIAFNIHYIEVANSNKGDTTTYNTFIEYLKTANFFGYSSGNLDNRDLSELVLYSTPRNTSNKLGNSYIYTNYSNINYDYLGKNIFTKDLNDDFVRGLIFDVCNVFILGIYKILIMRKLLCYLYRDSKLKYLLRLTIGKYGTNYCIDFDNSVDSYYLYNNRDNGNEGELTVLGNSIIGDQGKFDDIYNLLEKVNTLDWDIFNIINNVGSNKTREKAKVITFLKNKYADYVTPYNTDAYEKIIDPDWFIKRLCEVSTTGCGLVAPMVSLYALTNKHSDDNIEEES